MPPNGATSESRSQKFALLNDGERWGRPTGGLPTTHILKLQIDGYLDQHINEHICVRAASELGLIAEKSWIESFEDEQVIVVERYDRWRSGDRWLRIHQEDFCQALAVWASQKYQNEGGPGPSAIVGLLRKVQSEEIANESINRFVDALIFNWLIVGSDAHAKNYSLLLRGKQIRLAPLYDVTSVLPYPDQFYIRKQGLAMKIGSEYKALSIGERHWRQLADDLNVSGNYVVDRAVELADNVFGAFEVVCEEPSTKSLKSDIPALLLSTIKERAQVCKSQLAKRS